jgi:hypothetical protein
MIGWLATGTRMKLNGNMNNCLCNEEENNDHLFLCGNRAERRIQFYSDMQKQFTCSKTGTHIIDGIIEGIQKWSGDKPSIECEGGNPQKRDRDWKLLMRGIQLKAWATTYDTEETAAKKPGDLWQSEIIVWITRELYEIWKERNAAIYEKNVENETTKAELEVQSQVKFLYNTRGQMSSFDAHDLLQPALKQRLEFTAATNKEWVRQ